MQSTLYCITYKYVCNNSSSSPCIGSHRTQKTRLIREKDLIDISNLWNHPSVTNSSWALEELTVGSHVSRAKKCADVQGAVGWFVGLAQPFATRGQEIIASPCPPLQPLIQTSPATDIISTDSIFPQQHCKQTTNRGQIDIDCNLPCLADDGQPTATDTDTNTDTAERR